MSTAQIQLTQTMERTIISIAKIATQSTPSITYERQLEMIKDVVAPVLSQIREAKGLPAPAMTTSSPINGAIASASAATDQVTRLLQFSAGSNVPVTITFKPRHRRIIGPMGRQSEGRIAHGFIRCRQRHITGRGRARVQYVLVQPHQSEKHGTVIDPAHILLVEPEISESE